MGSVEGGRRLVSKFLRHFNDWELELVPEFTGAIPNNNILPFVKDQLVLKITKDGAFSVKSCFDKLEGESVFRPFLVVLEFLCPF